MNENNKWVTDKTVKVRVSKKMKCVYGLVFLNILAGADQTGPSSHLKRLQ